jgi:hypothetical protein
VEVMGHSININELVKRPIIRHDFNEEWMNKMTDEELKIYDEEVYAVLFKEGYTKYPDTNVGYLTKHIDRSILYKLFKEQEI